MKKLSLIIPLLLVTLVAPSTAASFKLAKKIVNQPGNYLQSDPKLILPKNLIVQGSVVYYKVIIPRGSSIKEEDITCTYGFEKKQGNIKFLTNKSGDRHYFRADWYGENIITCTVVHKKTGQKTVLKDSAFCHFASRQVLGGNGDNLTDQQKKNIRRGDIHDIHAAEKGMAYLPADITRGDKSSDQISKGFFETTEPRIFQTKKGTLIAAIQARRIGKNDAPAGQGIVVKRSTDQGATWTDGMLLDQNGNDVWGYSALVEVDGTLYCYAVAGHPGHQDCNKKIRGIYYYTSTNEGKTWSTRKRHDELSAAIGLDTSKKIPSGASPNCNILVVPGLTLDGQKAPDGQGLLFSTYAHGYIWASINGGKNWSMVADYRHYANGKTNGLGKPVSIENELGWCTLDNKGGDIYMIWRRQASKGYKNEYLVSRHFKTGKDGMTVRAVYNQDLKNVQARRCHFGLRSIPQGNNRGRLLLATQGSGSRSHIRLGVSKRAVTGSAISDGLFDEVTVMLGIGWGYCDIEYLNANHPAHKSMGKDAIIMLGESEPIHSKTYQYIPLKPAGKGKNERYTATAFILSMEYFEFLKKNSK